MEGGTLLLVGDQACSGEPDPVEGQAALSFHEVFFFPPQVGLFREQGLFY